MYQQWSKNTSLWECPVAAGHWWREACFPSFFCFALPFQLPPATLRGMKANPSGSCCHLRPSPASQGRRPCCRPLQTQHRRLLRAEPTTFRGLGPNLTFELRGLRTPHSLLSSGVVTAVRLLQSHSTHPLFTLPAVSEPGVVCDGSAVSPKNPCSGSSSASTIFLETIQ